MNKITNFLLGFAGITAGVTGCLMLLFMVLFIKPLILMGLIWVLINLCSMAIPMITFWQSVVIVIIIAVLFPSNSNNTKTIKNENSENK